MRVSDYFGGIRLTMTSPFPPHELERRIEAATVNRWTPSARGVSGWARNGKLQLRSRRRSRRENDLPVLAGRVSEGNRGSRLDLCFRAPWSITVFYALWYGGLFFVFLPLHVFGEGAANRSAAESWLIPAGLALVPLFVDPFSLANADKGLAELTRFLEREIEAKVIPSDTIG